MVAYRIIGNNLVSEDEFVEKGLDEKLTAAASREKIDNIMLSSGAELAFAESLSETPQVRDGNENPLPEIGYGKPLTVEVRHAYAGGLGSNGSQIAVVSGVRNWGVTKASARALNFVSKRDRFQPLDLPSALQNGTPIIAYQKAVTSRQINAAFEMGATSRFEEVAGVVSTAFQTAANIPLLMPYAGMLMAASQIFPIAGRFATSLAGGEMQWRDHFDINLGRPIGAPSKAEMRIVAKPAAQLDRNYKYMDGVGLVDQSGNRYAGLEPYVVVAIHGFEDSELEKFEPAVASAELLEKFHLAEKAGGGVVNDLLQVVQIASDVRFRQLALEAKERMAGATAGSDAYNTAKAEYDAAIKNIRSADLKPKD